MRESLDVLTRVLQRFATESLSHGYEVLMEADACAWLFHLLLQEPRVPTQELHLCARVCDAEGLFDLVVGATQIDASGRVALRPRIAGEIKVFPRIGFTGPAQRVHYKHVLDDDLRKLGSLPKVVSTAEILVDGARYLDGTYARENRLVHLLQTRDRIAPVTHVFVLQPNEGGWAVAHERPTTT